MTEEERIDQAESRMRLLAELTSHIGEANAIGMAELYETVYERTWDNRINDTRKLRTLVTAMRAEGVPICSTAAQDGGGYYLAAAGSELVSYLRRGERRALAILGRNAKIKRVSLPNYLGQIKLNMEGAGDGEKAA
jgi:hypothetical protein